MPTPERSRCATMGHRSAREGGTLVARKPNRELRAARERTPSPNSPGLALRRSELAELAAAEVYRRSGRVVALDAHYIAKLERGVIRWPSRIYREALRTVLGVTTDSALGFHPPQAQCVPLTSPVPASSASEVGGVIPSTMAGDVASIHAMVAAFQAADRTVGGGSLYASVMRYLTSEILPRLVDPAAELGEELFAAAAMVTELAGWMAHDAGRDETARAHFDRASRLAAAAERPALAAKVCASMSHLAVQLGQPAEAVGIADDGLRRAQSQPGAGRLMARLYAMRARGLALSGESRDCAAGLCVAEETLAAAEDEQPAKWLADFDEASLASEASLCWRALGRPDEAECAARRVITLRPGDRVRSRAFGQLTLARVLLDDDRPDEAADAGQAVCWLAPSLTSARVLAGLDELGDALTPHRGVAEVGAFLDHLNAVRGSPGRRPAPGSRWPV